MTQDSSVFISPGIESRFVIIGGRRIHYFTAGHGPSVVLLHGGASDARDWLNTMEALSSHYRLYAPDLIGFGESERDAKGYYLSDFNDCLAVFIATLTPEKPALVGHSFSGRMCLEVAHRNPEMISKLILIDAAGLGRISLVGHALFGGFALARKFMGKQQPFPTFLAKEGENYNDIGQEALKSIRTPTLIIWKSVDPYMPLGLGKRAAKLIPGARLVVFKGYGHAPHQKENAAFNKVLGEFLDSPALPV
jgi:pimeloyl-ACP methyl ester carboxylesterase